METRTAEFIQKNKLPLIRI